MTIQATTAWGGATGTGITGPYSIPFPLYSQSHLTVLEVTNNVPTTLNLGTDYFFSQWNPDNKGQVENPQITFTNAVAGGVGIVFLLTPPGTQLTSITDQDAFFPSLHEAEYDLEAQFALRQLEWVKKSIKAPDQEQSGTANLTLPPIVSRASMVLGFDAAGDVYMYPQSGGGIMPIVGLPFASLPTPQSSFMLAMCSDGPIAAYNTVLNTWVKLDQVSP